MMVKHHSATGTVGPSLSNICGSRRIVHDTRPHKNESFCCYTILIEWYNANEYPFQSRLSNGPYSSFRLKARLWGQNHRNLHNFCVSTDMTVVTNRYALYAKEHLKTKFCLYRTLINKTRLINV